MKRASPDYLLGLRLTLTDAEHQAVQAGQTPKSIPKHLIVSRAECHGRREVAGQALVDYRVYFKDGTYDNISITPVMKQPEMNKYFRREPGRGDFVSWGDL